MILVVLRAHQQVLLVNTNLRAATDGGDTTAYITKRTLVRLQSIVPAQTPLLAKMKNGNGETLKNGIGSIVTARRRKRTLVEATRLLTHQKTTMSKKNAFAPRASPYERS